MPNLVDPHDRRGGAHALARLSSQSATAARFQSSVPFGSRVGMGIRPSARHATQLRLQLGHRHPALDHVCHLKPPLVYPVLGTEMTVCGAQGDAYEAR